jgi:hypothetical protein
MENKSNKKGSYSNYFSATFIYLISIGFLINALKIKDPTSRMFPIVICIISIIIATVLVLQTRLNLKNSDENVDFSGMNISLKMFEILIVYVVAIEIASFYIATPIYLYVTMMSLGQKNKKLMIIVSVLFTLAVYLFFDLLLGMEIPMGRFLN